MLENPRRSRQARNFTTTVPKTLDLKSSSEQIFFRKLSLGAPERSERVRFFIQKQRERKYRTPALSMKYSLYLTYSYKPKALILLLW